MRGWGLLLRVQDRPGALERVLGLARRRAMALHTDAIARGSDGLWTVVFRVTGDEARLEQYANEFRELVDLQEALTLTVSQSAEPVG